MGLLNRLQEPVVLKTTSSATTQLAALESLLDKVSGNFKGKLLKDIAIIKAGILGEKNILFELKNSHLPMYVLHDIYITHGDLTAQIDFLVVTRKITYILECKNLIGNIEVRNNGDFIRVFSYGQKTAKEGIYSPITQNERHLELLRQKRAASKGPINKLLFERYFNDFNRAIVVLANPKTILNDRYAPKNIKNKIVKADQLIRYIQDTNIASNTTPSSDKSTKELAETLLAMHEEHTTDYASRYVDALRAAGEKASDNQEKACPLCGKSLVPRKGQYGDFIGCSGYPACTFTAKTY